MREGVETKSECETYKNKNTYVDEKHTRIDVEVIGNKETLSPRRNPN